MATKSNTGVPGIPQAALDAITDENIRIVLRALVDGWMVRNGDTGNQDSKFLTKADLSNLNHGGYFVGGTGRTADLTIPGAKIKPGDISRVITDLEGQIFSSALWLDLGTRIDDIDLTIVQEQKDRVQAIADEAAARLGFESVTGSAIESLQVVDESQALLIEGLTTRVGGSENTIITLQETTEDHAQTLTSLTSTLGDATSNISVLYETTAATANALTVITSDLGDVHASLTEEIETRVGENTAITENFTNQIATVNSSISAISEQQTTLANSISAVASSVSTMQASVTGFNAKLQTESETRANVDGTMLSKYTVKTDLNGYVAGYGLMSEANNGAVTSSFIVRADAFAIGSPEGPQSTAGEPSVEPAIPFIVRTTEGTASNGSTIPVGVYMRSSFIENASITTAHIGAAAITNALIGDAQIDTAKIEDLSVTTLKIANNAVSVMNIGSGSNAKTNLVVPANSTMKIVCMAFYDGLEPTFNFGIGNLLSEKFSMTLNLDTKSTNVGTVFKQVRISGGPSGTTETTYGFAGATLVNSATIDASDTPATVEAFCTHTYGSSTIIMLGILK